MPTIPPSPVHLRPVTKDMSPGLWLRARVVHTDASKPAMSDWLACLVDTGTNRVIVPSLLDLLVFDKGLTPFTPHGKSPGRPVSCTGVGSSCEAHARLGHIELKDARGDVWSSRHHAPGGVQLLMPIMSDRRTDDTKKKWRAAKTPSERNRNLGYPIDEHLGSHIIIGTDILFLSGAKFVCEAKSGDVSASLVLP